jgi:hypothetical protein
MIDSMKAALCALGRLQYAARAPHGARRLNGNAPSVSVASLVTTARATPRLTR